MIDDRLAVVAHELRSPVAALAAIAEAAASCELAADERRRLVELALAAGLNVERILRDATPTSVELEPLDPGRLVSDAAETARLGGAPIRAEVAPRLPPIEGDRERLRQLLDNLIANAVGHSPAGAEVVVSARTVGDRVLLAVSDQGKGITPRDQARIFESGVRATDSRPGSGLGLALARAIAEAHGGELTVESTPGAGATFTLALPFSSAARG